MRLAALLASVALPLAASTWYITVAGLGGLPEYDSRFQELAAQVDKTLKAAGGDAKIQTLAGSGATLDNLRAVLKEAARAAQPKDDLALFLIGHGTFDGADYKFNLKGPDVSASELASLLDAVPAGRQLVVNTTSSSGGAIEALRRENRVVISATRSGTEKNATIFARYVVEALQDPSADTDKNETLSALEVFRYAEQKTAKFYETQKRLATEHPTLEDGSKGLAAARFGLLRLGAAQIAARNPEKQKLLARKDELEGQIEKLKYEKAAMPLDEYRKKLQALLIDLARTQAELDK